MDRKNKRHSAGKQTNRSDRKKTRVGPGNRFVAEKVTVNTSTSEQKLNTSFEGSEVSIDPSVSYRVIMAVGGNVVSWRGFPNRIS